MTRKSILLFTAVLGCSLISFEAITNATGAPAGRNGSPSSAGTCAVAGCHNGPAVSTESVSITTDISSAGFQENTNYTITITADDGGRGLSRMGFQASVENASGPQGTLTPADNQSQQVGSSHFVTHTFSGTNVSGGTKSWDLNWNSGTAADQSKVYVAVNFSNNNGVNTGDVILTADLTLDKDGTVNLEEHHISEWSVYPNPASERIYLKDIPSGSGTVALYDLSGQKLMEITTEKAGNGVDLSRLSQGEYLLRHEASGTARHLKILR